MTEISVPLGRIDLELWHVPVMGPGCLANDHDEPAQRLNGLAAGCPVLPHRVSGKPRNVSGGQRFKSTPCWGNPVARNNGP
jgi:hypothetical protein